MTLDDLFKRRQTHFLKQLMKYGQLVFNDHFMLILVLFVGVLGYTYSTWLQTIDYTATYLAYIALTIGYMTTFWGSTATYLESADALFLLPKEKEYIAVYKLQTIKSYLINIIPTVIAVIVITPILTKIARFDVYEIGAVLLMLASMKAIDVIYIFYTDMMSGRQKSKRYHWGLRAGMYVAVLLSVQFIMIIAVVSLFITVIVAYHGFHKLPTTLRLPLATLIDREQDRRQRIYYFFHLFTDVPYVQQKPRRLRLLDPVIHYLQPQDISSFGYYMRRESVRQRTYSGVVGRLLVIGALAIIFIDQPLMIYVISLLSHYLILVQLLPLRETLLKHPQFTYHPPTANQVRQDMQIFLRQLSTVISLLFGSVGLMHSLSAGSAIIGLNFLLMAGFIYLYLPYYFKK